MTWKILKKNTKQLLERVSEFLIVKGYINMQKLIAFL